MTRAEVDAGTTLDERELRRIRTEKHAERWRKRVARQAALEEAAKQAAAAAEPAETTTEEAYAREQKERLVFRFTSVLF
jgi:HJR/Mrr/RecB family endonuclease